MARVRQHEVERVTPEERVPQTTERPYVLPPVDIYEVGDALVLEADMPGVRKDGIEVKVDANTLTIEGRVKPPENVGDPVYQEFQMADYFRSFVLSEYIDTGRITADLNAGVLKITLPKGPATRTRKIEVKMK